MADDAKMTAELREAKRHAVELEQCALFVDSEPLARSMTDAAMFLRALAHPQPEPGRPETPEAVDGAELDALEELMAGEADDDFYVMGADTELNPHVVRSLIAEVRAARAQPSDEAVRMTYEDAHATAVELGYPSLTEALEALSARARPVALDSALAEERRQERVYKLIQEVDHFLHDVTEVDTLKQRAIDLHSRIHEEAYQLVTRPVADAGLREALTNILGETGHGSAQAPFAVRRIRAICDAALAAPQGAVLPRFVWSRVDPGEMNYTEVTLGFGSPQDAELFRRIVSARQTAPASECDARSDAAVEAALWRDHDARSDTTDAEGGKL